MDLKCIFKQLNSAYGNNIAVTLPCMLLFGLGFLAFCGSKRTLDSFQLWEKKPSLKGFAAATQCGWLTGLRDHRFGGAHVLIFLDVCYLSFISLSLNWSPVTSCHCCYYDSVFSFLTALKVADLGSNNSLVIKCLFQASLLLPHLVFFHPQIWLYQVL